MEVPVGVGAEGAHVVGIHDCVLVAAHTVPLTIGCLFGEVRVGVEAVRTVRVGCVTVVGVCECEIVSVCFRFPCIVGCVSIGIVGSGRGEHVHRDGFAWHGQRLQCGVIVSVTVER